MAISFHNTYYDDIIENLSKIINDEFSIPVYFDEIKSNSFLLTPDSDDLVEYLSNGIQRDFNVNIIYELKQAGNYNKNDFKQVTNVMERLRRLIFKPFSFLMNQLYLTELFSLPAVIVPPFEMIIFITSHEILGLPFTSTIEPVVFVFMATSLNIPRCFASSSLE